MAIRELAETWASVYSNSVAIRTAVSFAHFGGLLVGGGTAIASDLDMLAALRHTTVPSPDAVGRLRSTHLVVVSSLVVVVASGGLLLLKDLDALLESRPFWIKMGLFVLLLLNGLLVVRAERRSAVQLRLAAIASLVLWLAVTLAGTVVPNAL